jgi:hypothetical protein
VTVKAQLRIACDQTVTSRAVASKAAKDRVAKDRVAKDRVAGNKREIHDNENRKVRTLSRKKRLWVSNGRASKRVGDSLVRERKVIAEGPRLSVVEGASDLPWIGLQPNGSSELH